MSEVDTLYCFISKNHFLSSLIQITTVSCLIVMDFGMLCKEGIYIFHIGYKLS